MAQKTPAMTNAALLARREKAIPRGPFNVGPIFVDRAEGSRVWDVDGNEYIDFCGGIGVLNVGHNHPRVVEAIERQLRRLIHSSWHVAMYEEYVRLAERLNELSPTPGPNKSCFFNSGAEAVENAVKVARASTGRAAIVCFERGFHGRTLMGMSLTGKVHPYCAGFGPFAPEVYRLPYQPFYGSRSESDADVERACLEALDHLFAYHVQRETVACLLLEPVLGEGGFLPLRRKAAEVLRAVTREHGILLVDDEVQSGFGRCGSLFAAERYALEPDVLVTAKSLAGGMPLSGITAPADVIDAPAIGGLGGTYGGNPLACAAASAVLDVMEAERLPERAEELGTRVMDVFRSLVDDCPRAGEARGLGAMCGLAIVDPDSGRPDPVAAQRIVTRCLEKGLLIMTASGNVLRTLMPLTIRHDELDRALGILDRAVRE